MSRVGIIGDTHLPFTHPLYLSFVSDTFSKWRVNKVVHIGDVVDNHAINFHEHDPDGMSSGREVDKARAGLRKWVRTFPNVVVDIGNHDELQARQARKHGISMQYMKDYAEVWDTPRWKWEFDHHIDGVQYVHGTGNSGKEAALNLAVQSRMPTVIGHIHSWAGVKWHANKRSKIFGMNVGCGIDCRAYAFAYGRDFVVRPMLGCGIVIDGAEAHFIPMPCGPGERYNRSRAGRKR